MSFILARNIDLGQDKNPISYIASCMLGDAYSSVFKFICDV
ncbi:hypothetical protein THOA03_70094 [Vibrio owensii]|nr:hypothetical protein THOA03_70094 [Vibrio owensii]